MKMAIDVEADAFKDMLNRYPRAMSESIGLFADRVGFSIERQAKKEAPAISGNLRRNIIYADKTISSFMNNTEYGVITAHANYSKYVHGQPFYKNKMRRKETPFFTNAISTLDTFIKDEARDAVKRVLE
ncbi:HK97 gp10 family phage protein [Sulfitobacter sp. 1A10445]|uniref:HK97 gp10 family phage protein n=2 Tax=unclassified Sulfitobacter TaxID=196795 RepID=UPI003746F321